jgi:hypothetical protein
MVKSGLLALTLAVCAAAQSPKTSTFDSRLGMSTSLREDLFSGFLSNNNEGPEFLRGEKNLEILLAERPAAKPALLAWKADIALKRAADAAQSNRAEIFERQYRNALDLFAEAARLGPSDFAVMAITGGGYYVFADRLPERYRADAWNAAYKAYSGLWQAQGAQVSSLPLHMKGELLSGMAQSAQRSGRAAESAQFLDRIVTILPGTPYATAAKKWIDSPGTAANTKLTCQTCHDAGRLEARKAALAQAK